MYPIHRCSAHIRDLADDSSSTRAEELSAKVLRRARITDLRKASADLSVLVDHKPLPLCSALRPSTSPRPLRGLRRAMSAVSELESFILAYASGRALDSPGSRPPRPPGFDDPEVMAAVNDIAANPQAVQKYRSNKKVGAARPIAFLLSCMFTAQKMHCNLLRSRLICAEVSVAR